MLRISLTGFTRDGRAIIRAWEQPERSWFGKPPLPTNLQLHLLKPGALPMGLLNQLLLAGTVTPVRLLTESEVITLLEQGYPFTFDEIGKLAGYRLADKLRPAYPAIYSENERTRL